MNILMVTNTYKPILGGLEKSIEAFSEQYRRKGHRVVIVAPEFGRAGREPDVIRIPAIQNFNGTDFSVLLPVPGVLDAAMGDFRPDLVHSHHPFLAGDTALRLAHKFNVPLVFTHHTLYEQNTHYVPGDSGALKQFVIQLATGYANLADAVFAPSESVRELIRGRGVITNVHVVPTGLDVERFSEGDGRKVLGKLGIGPRAFVVGHLGRLAPEKNLEFVAHAVSLFLAKNRDAHFLVAGKGPSDRLLKKVFEAAGVGDRLHLTGPVEGQDLVDVYHAMDVFAVASQSETQGLVLTEAMAAGVPVVGVDAPGVRDVVQDKRNGRLLPGEHGIDFAEALQWVHEASPEQRRKLSEAARKTAARFSMDACASHALEIYEGLVLVKDFVRRNTEDSTWSQTVRLIQAHWGVMKNLTRATTEAFLRPPGD